MALLLDEARRQGRPVTVPTTVLAQVVRDPSRQVGVMRLLGRAVTGVAELDRPTAVAIGRLLGATSTTDIADAHVAIVATAGDDAVVTSDPEDIRRLAPAQPIVVV